MSKKTGSQKEVELLEQILKAKQKLQVFQQKHKVEIGNLAYKHGLHQFDVKHLDLAFAKLASELKNENHRAN